MPDIPVPRAFRADRRLLSTLTDSPQLIRYLESLGVDLSSTIPDTFAELLSLIIDAAEVASSAQGAANRSAQSAAENALAIQSLDIPSATRVNEIGRLITELQDRIEQQSDQRITQILRKVDELEAIISELHNPRLDAYAGIVAPTAWTPVLTFATPGNLAVAYSSQTGTYTKIGRQVFISYYIVTSSFTWTTSTGGLLVNGLPFISNVQNFVSGQVDFNGITKAGYTQVNSSISAGTNSIQYVANGSGVARNSITTADVPSGGTVVLSGTMSFFT